MVLDYWGKDTGHLHTDGTVTAVLNAERFKTDRKHFEPWRDADRFEIII